MTTKVSIPNCDCEYCRRNPSEADRVNDKLVNETAQREFLGNVSHMWLRRRAADPRFRFPEPVCLGRRRARWASDLAAWVESPHAQLRSERHFGEADAA